MAKVIGCQDITPMDVCGFAVQAESADEVIEHIFEHSKSRHGTKDQDVTPEEMSLVRSRVRDVPARTPPAFTPVTRAKPQLLYCIDVNGGECVFAVQTNDLEEILEHLRLHHGVRHSMADEGTMRELLELARSRIRPWGEAS